MSDEKGLTQKMIAMLSGVTVSAVNKYILSNNILPIKKKAKNLRYNIQDVRRMTQHFLKNDAIKKKVHAFYNFKGGTGKTSICYQVSSHISLMGFKVLVVDCDPQAHLSTTYGFSSESDFLTMYDVIINDIGVDEAIKKIHEGLDCIPSNLSLTKLEIELNAIPRREERIYLSLHHLREEYDFIFIDTNPTISLLNRNVITFADVLNVVCEPATYSLNGLKILVDDLSKFYNYMRIEGGDLNIIPNKYEDRTVNSAEGMTVLRKFYNDYIKRDFAIRKSEDIVNSSRLQTALCFFVKINSIALEDVIELVQYIINQSKENNDEKDKL